MKNRVTDRDNKKLSDEAYKISEGTVKEKRLTSYGKFNVLNVKNQPRYKSWLSFLSFFVERK